MSVCVLCVSVYVKVGSPQFFSPCLLMVLQPQHQQQCSSGAKVRVPGGCNYCRIPSNCITWCKTELVRTQTPLETHLDLSRPPETQFNPPEPLETHLDPPGPSEASNTPPGPPDIHLDPPGPPENHLDPPGPPETHLDPKRTLRDRRRPYRTPRDFQHPSRAPRDPPRPLETTSTNTFFLCSLT